MFYLLLFCFLNSLFCNFIDPYIIDLDEEEYDYGISEDKEVLDPAFSSFGNIGFLLSPVYLNDGDAHLGGADALLYYDINIEDKNPYSYSALNVLFGSNSYFNLGVKTNNYWSSHNIYSRINYSKNRLNFNSNNLYQLNGLDLYFAYRNKIFSNIYLGGFYNFINSSISNKTSNFDLNTSRMSGVGIIFGNLDIDPIITYTDGFYFNIENSIYLEVLGSSHDFSKHIIDVRDYFRFFKFNLICLQVFAKFHNGNPSYNEKYRISEIFRPYSYNYGVLKHLTGFRAEYRANLLKQINIATFLGFAYGGDKFSDFKRYIEYGGGVRVLINKTLKLWTRLDYARGIGGSDAIIITLGEAF